MTVVLDAWAIMAVLEDEPSGGRVQERIDAGGAVVSWVNLTEVIDKSSRRRGPEATHRIVSTLRALMRTELPDERTCLDAAAVKASARVSLADAFAVATARRHNAPLWTGDPEIVALDTADLDVIDLRAGA